mmetsp:Transcript_11766/g.15535  ORF Transcript_11766/g.15535 Transcript_11766/m.15535 type:complete len:102 (-) Transcript_11766:447-752(-)
MGVYLAFVLFKMDRREHLGEYGGGPDWSPPPSHPPTLHRLYAKLALSVPARRKARSLTSSLAPLRKASSHYWLYVKLALSALALREASSLFTGSTQQPPLM